MFLKDQPFSKMAPPLPNPGSATVDSRIHDRLVKACPLVNQWVGSLL